jgi:hypothetical protein
VVNCLFCKHEALSSNPSPTKTKIVQSGYLWLMPIILAIQEAEIRRITAQGQPGQIVL